jgi:hypothetical protein
MRIGLFPLCSDYSIPAYELAIAAEKRWGYFIWLSEHTHIPASRDTPSSGAPVICQERWSVTSVADDQRSTGQCAAHCIDSSRLLPYKVLEI